MKVDRYVTSGAPPHAVITTSSGKWALPLLARRSDRAVMYQ
jgi:hypothetical protein